MKIAILGAGAMGSLYATYLTQHHDVVLLDAYGPLVTHLRANGLVKVERDGSESLFRIRAEESGADLCAQDLVIVFVKGMHTLEAVRGNLSLIGPETLVMTLQNGAGNNRDIAQVVDRRRIIVGTSSHNSVSQGLGRFSHSGCGPTNIGPEVPDETTMRDVARVADALLICGLETNVLENIQKVLWQKLFVNCGVNAITTVMQCRIGDVADNPHIWALCRGIVDECVKVAEADGTRFERDEVLAQVLRVIRHDATGYASMYQDRQHRRQTEIDRINGVVVALGREYGIPVPFNEMIQTQIHAVEFMYANAG